MPNQETLKTEMPDIIFFDGSDAWNTARHGNVTKYIRSDLVNNAWQPIETAQKDGTPILIQQTTGHFKQCFVAAWRVDDDYEDGGHWFIDDGKFEHPQRGHEPTQWMPLPAPPAVEKMKGQRDE